MAVPPGFSYTPRGAASYDRTPQYVRVNGVLQVFWDANGQPYHQTTSGERRYIDPRQATQGAQPGMAGYTDQNRRLQEWAASQGVTTTANDRGGATMTNPTAWRPNGMFSSTIWNPTSGRFERDIDRGLLAMTLGSGALVGGGIAAALGAGGAGAGAVPLASTGAPAGTTAATTAAGFTPVATTGGAVTSIPGGYSLAVAPAATAGGGATIAGVPLAAGAAATPAAIQAAAQGEQNAGTPETPPTSYTDPPLQDFNEQFPQGTPGTQLPVERLPTASGWQDWLRNEGVEDVGEFVSGMGRGARDERNAENLWRQSRDSISAQLARDQALFDLQGAQSTYDRNRLQQNDIFDTGMRSATFGRENQSREMRQSLLSGLIGGAEDFKITGNINPAIAARIPTTTGGLRPSMLNNSRESILATLGRPQVQAPTYTPPTPYAPPAPYRPPVLPDYERAGAGETAANTVGGIMRLGGPLIRRLF